MKHIAVSSAFTNYIGCNVPVVICACDFGVFHAIAIVIFISGRDADLL